MFVLDTNIVIFFFRGQGEVARHLLATSPSEIGIPAISVYEIEVGIAKSRQSRKRRQQLEELLGLVRTLQFDRAAAKAAASVRANLERTGRPIGPMDTLIAGTALAQDGRLVTHNTREFRRVPKLKLIDWYA